MKEKVSVIFMLMGILFCVCLITANLLETKLIQLGGLTLTAGLLVFPISYILNDCLVEVWGFRRARLIIYCGFSMNLLVMLAGLVAIALPAAPFWEGEEHFNFVFGMTPRIVVGSLMAFLTGSLLNAQVMSRMKRKDGNKRFSLRAIWSTVVGEGADSVIFFPIAFGGLVEWRELAGMMIAQVVLKTAYEVIVLPLTILTVRTLKKIEQDE